MDIRTVFEVNAKIVELERTCDENFVLWRKENRKLEQAEEAVRAAKGTSGYEAAAAHAYECIHNDRDAFNNFNWAKNALVAARDVFYKLDNPGDGYPGDQATAVSRLLNGDD